MAKSKNKGVLNGRSKLSDVQVLEIRQNKKASMRLLAMRYEVSVGCVWNIKNYKTYIKSV